MSTATAQAGTLTTCAACGVYFAMERDYEARRRQDGHTFYCPNGHSLSFTESETDRLRRKVKNAEADAEAERRWRESAERSLAATKGVVTKMRKRAIAGVCQFCHRHFANVERHVAGQHPGEVADPG